MHNARPAFLPNLLIVYLDDAGYADTGPTGAAFPTPNLDALAAEGTLYASFHVLQPSCSPSRAALLTGVYPNRIGITGALFPDDTFGLNPDEVPLAEVAKQRGYRTVNQATLNVVSPVTAGGGAALDGNVSAIRTAISGTVAGGTLAMGTYLWVRFRDNNDSGGDHGLAADDLVISGFVVPQ